MTTTTITLPDDVARLVEDEARRRSTSVSDVIRDSLVKTLPAPSRRELAFAAICDDDRLPPASQLEEALERTWADDLDRRRR